MVGHAQRSVIAISKSSTVSIAMPPRRRQRISRSPDMLRPAFGDEFSVERRVMSDSVRYRVRCAASSLGGLGTVRTQDVATSRRVPGQRPSGRPRRSPSRRMRRFSGSWMRRHRPPRRPHNAAGARAA